MLAGGKEGKVGEGKRAEGKGKGRREKGEGGWFGYLHKALQLGL